MKHFFHLLILISTLGLNAQDSSVDVMLGLDYSFRHLYFQADDPSTNFMVEARAAEAPSINARFGLNYNHKIGEHKWIKTGLRIADLGYKLGLTTDLVWPSELETGVFIFDPSLPHEIQFINNLIFIEIPLALRYEFKQTKWTPFVEMGVSTSLFVGNYKQQVTDISSDFKYEPASSTSQRNLQMAAVFSFGLIQDYTENLQVFIQPSFRYHLTAWQKSTIREHLTNGGIEIGVRRKITNTTLAQKTVN